MTQVDYRGGREFLQGPPEPDEYTFAYIEGAAAWIFGDDKCPYPDCSEEWRLWHKGYSEVIHNDSEGG